MGDRVARAKLERRTAATITDRRRLVALVQKTARTICHRLASSSSRSSPRKESR